MLKVSEGINNDKSEIGNILISSGRDAFPNKKITHFKYMTAISTDEKWWSAQDVIVLSWKGESNL